LEGFGFDLAGGFREVCTPWVWVIWSLIPIGTLYALVQILCTGAWTLKANGVPATFLLPDHVALARLAQMEQPKAQA